MARGRLARTWLHFRPQSMRAWLIINEPSGWHSRGYLPHWEAGETPQSITFRLADSLPKAVLERWRDELAKMPAESASLEQYRRVEAALDSGHGSGVLAQARIGEIVEGALLYFDAEWYRLHGWVVMPNHVHVLITPLGDRTLSKITHSWKSYTAKAINNVLHKQGQFWAPEYFDRTIRSSAHFWHALGYIAMNPVKAGLCSNAEDWRYSSTWHIAQAEKGGRDARAPYQPERKNLTASSRSKR